MLGTLLDRFRKKGPRRPRSKAATEKRRSFLFVLLIVLAVVSSISIVGYGYYDTNVKPWHQPILKVNDTVFDMRYFVNVLRLYGVTSADSASSIVSTIEENELARQYLESEFPDVDLGDVTSDEAVEAKLRKNFVSYGLISDNATEDEYQQAYQKAQDSLKTVGVSMNDYEKLIIEPSLISEELKKQIGNRDYPATDNFEHAQVQALLVMGSDNATLVRTRWENGGPFDTLAKEESVSESLRDTATDNTTIEWVAKGIKSTAFDNWTFSETAIGVLSDLAQDSDSSENYWVIKVLARESRPLSNTDRDTLVSAASTKWLEDAKTTEENEIVNYLDEKGGTAKLTWALDQVSVSTS